MIFLKKSFKPAEFKLSNRASVNLNTEKYPEKFRLIYLKEKIM